MTHHTTQILIHLKALYIGVRYVLLRFVSPSTLLTSVYFAFFTTSFRREKRAVMAGLLNHMRHLRSDASLFLLRRNIHRLEKGLVMPGRREVFALEYIGETVDYYEKCLNQADVAQAPRELNWATDILHHYFAAVNSHPIVDEARERFLRLVPKQGGEAVPYQRGREACPVSYDELIALVRRRKSVRTFLQKPVPHELVDRALKLAVLSPSSCNRQPMHYHIFDEPPLLREMAALPIGTPGFAENIPMVCAVTGDLSAYFYERDRHSIYVDGCLSAMLFMLALETVGLASCPLNWPEIDWRDRKLERLAGLPPHERGILFIAIGYPDPDGLVAYSEKKNLDQLRSFNQGHTSGETKPA